MKNNYELTISGLDNTSAQKVAYVISLITNKINENNSLDLRRLKRIVVSTNIQNEINVYMEKENSPFSKGITDGEHAKAIAQVRVTRVSTGYEITIFFDAGWALYAVNAVETKKSENEFDIFLHQFHHELCHVHDSNKKIDFLLKNKNSINISGKKEVFYLLSERCWSEYIANRLSSSTATEDSVEMMSGVFFKMLDNTKSSVDASIEKYRYNGDLEGLVSFFNKDGHFLLVSLCYMLGYVDGLESESGEKLRKQLEKKISKSYLSSIYKEIHNSLVEMFELYPSKWKGLKVYDNLIKGVENYHILMGYEYQDMPSGELYLRIPFK